MIHQVLTQKTDDIRRIPISNTSLNSQVSVNCFESKSGFGRWVYKNASDMILRYQALRLN